MVISNSLVNGVGFTEERGERFGCVWKSQSHIWSQKKSKTLQLLHFCMANNFLCVNWLLCCVVVSLTDWVSVNTFSLISLLLVLCVQIMMKLLLQLLKKDGVPYYSRRHPKHHHNIAISCLLIKNGTINVNHSSSSAVKHSRTEWEWE